jgi:hypothetical protein
VTEKILQFLYSHKNIARIAALGGTDDALLFQLVDDTGGPDIADLHLALQQ